MKLAIVRATGKLGGWVASFLSNQGHEVLLLGRRRDALKDVAGRVANSRVAEFTHLDEADGIIISVPLDAVDSVMQQISPYVLAGQVVIDLSSLKCGPLESAGRHIPQAVFLGVHPMFGSGAVSLAGHNVILTPTDDTTSALAQQIKSRIEPLGARVYTMDPCEHDELMSIVLGLPALAVAAVAKTILDSSRLAEAREVSGTSLELLMALTESMLCQGNDLYSMLLSALPASPRLSAGFTASAAHFAQMCERRDRAALHDEMAAMAQRLAESNHTASDAYDRMYAMLEALQRFPSKNQAPESA
ncbi:MAG: prephenate dehydrogenase/arogenate dehydrogenase family protein [Chloroflexota bacterium]